MSTIRLRDAGGIRTFSHLGAALGVKAPDPVLFLCPHDDDTAIGAGMLVAQAVREGLAVHIGIATDGRMGYCDAAQQETIVGTRARETLQAYRLLGVQEKRIHFLGFPDCSLYQHIGRRKAGPGESALFGHTGLQNSFTHLIRKLAPRLVFTPAGSDLHPDHQAVYKDLLISIYHAGGDIWPELGAPVTVPAVIEYPIYVALDGEPTGMLEGGAELFEAKLSAIAAYASQKQIQTLVNRLREAGPVEFFRNLQVEFYRPIHYRALFGV